MNMPEPWQIRDVKRYGWELSAVLERVMHGDGEKWPGEMQRAKTNFSIALNRLDLLRFNDESR